MAPCSVRLCSEVRNVSSDDLAEGFGQFAWPREAVCTGVFRENCLPVDGYVEDSVSASDERELGDHVLVCGKNFLGSAHGALVIISRDAVGN